MHFETIAQNLILKNDIWYSVSNSNISYPENANNDCFQLEENSFWFNHRNDCIVEIADQFLTSDKVIFDIGGGNGFVLSALERKGFTGVLVEPGEGGILNAKKRGITNLICSTFDDAQFKKESLTNVGLFDVVEHIQNDEEFLREIFLCLKPGGKVILTLPAYRFLWSGEDEFAGHYRRYSLSEIEKVLTSIGFKLIFKTYVFSFLPPIILFFRVLPWKLGLKSKPQEINKKEHEIKSGLFSKFLKKLQQTEVNKLKRRKRIRFGGSCLIVAEKI